MPFMSALTSNRASTDPASADRALQGRTYAIPFDQVWHSALRLASGGLARWTVTHADDHEGFILAEARTFVLRATDDVRIDVTLDEDAQTRVDVRSTSRVGRADLGANRRRIRAFCRALDRALDASPSQILDPHPRARRHGRVPSGA